MTAVREHDTRQWILSAIHVGTRLAPATAEEPEAVCFWITVCHNETLCDRSSPSSRASRIPGQQRTTRFSRSVARMGLDM